MQVVPSFGPHGDRQDRSLSIIDLIDARIAELARLAAEADLKSYEDGGAPLKVVLAALLALRQEKLGL